MWGWARPCSRPCPGAALGPGTRLPADNPTLSSGMRQAQLPLPPQNHCLAQSQAGPALILPLQPQSCPIPPSLFHPRASPRLILLRFWFSAGPAPDSSPAGEAHESPKELRGSPSARRCVLAPCSWLKAPGHWWPQGSVLPSSLQHPQDHPRRRRLPPLPPPAASTTPSPRPRRHHRHPHRALTAAPTAARPSAPARAWRCTGACTRASAPSPAPTAANASARARPWASTDACTPASGRTPAATAAKPSPSPPTWRCTGACTPASAPSPAPSVGSASARARRWPCTAAATPASGRTPAATAAKPSPSPPIWPPTAASTPGRSLSPARAAASASASAPASSRTSGGTSSRGGVGAGGTGDTKVPKKRTSGSPFTLPVSLQLEGERRQRPGLVTRANLLGTPLKAPNDTKIASGHPLTPETQGSEDILSSAHRYGAAASACGLATRTWGHKKPLGTPKRGPRCHQDPSQPVLRGERRIPLTLPLAARKPLVTRSWGHR